MKSKFIPILVLISLLRSNCKGSLDTHTITYNNTIDAETYSNLKGCNNIIPVSLKQEIASYKFIVKVLRSIVNSPDNADEFYNLFTTFLDKHGPRPSGSLKLEQSIEYIVNLTKSYGIKHVSTEEVIVPHWVRGEEVARLLFPNEKRLAILGLGTSVPTPLEGITAEVIVVKTFKELDKMDNDDVLGKIVVFNPVFTSYKDTYKYRAYGASRAAAKGAIATLIRSLTPFSLYTPHTGANEYFPNVTKIPTACITVEDADYLERTYREKTLIVIYLKMFNTFGYKHSRNTLIDLKGETDPLKMVIVSGHIDSWDVGQGALDNGGGMFISWYAPIVLYRLGLRPRRTIRALLWTGEEVGLVGSAAYLDRHKFELHHINFMLESDEGTFKPLGLEVGGSKLTRCVLAEILKLFKPINKIRETDAPGSDISAFIKKGIPGATLLNENDPYFVYHHTEADTVNVLNKEDIVNCASFWAALSYVLADLSIDLPQHIPTEF